MSTTRLLKGMGVQGQALHQGVKSLAEAAKQSSNWPWQELGNKMTISQNVGAYGMPGVTVEPLEVL